MLLQIQRTPLTKRIQGWLGGAGFLSKGRSSIFARRLFVLYHTCNPRLVIIVPTPVSLAHLRLCFFVLVFRLFFWGGGCIINSCPCPPFNNVVRVPIFLSHPKVKMYFSPYWRPMSSNAQDCTNLDAGSGEVSPKSIAVLVQ